MLGIVIDNAPEILFEIDEAEEKPSGNGNIVEEITIDLVKKMVDWDRKNNR